MNWHAYYRLMRLDKPVGILLLWFPTAWALWFANHGAPPWTLSILFFMGTILMRTAGCLINDIADRHLDRYVARTKDRPLAAGEVTLTATWGLFTGLLCVAYAILLQLPGPCVPMAFIALGLTLLYPFCKRFLKAPQCILGLAFSMGIPMAYAASYASLDETAYLLWGITILWVIAYDTEYAMADRDDDRRLGVQSTAILFGSYDRLIIGGLQTCCHVAWLLLASTSLSFYIGWSLGACVLLYQQTLIIHRTPTGCLLAFRTNTLYGFLMWLACL